MSKAASLILSIVISFGQTTAARAAAGQAEPKQNDRDQTIRLKSELVQVRAVVTDKQGQIIGNLKREDFELLENNRPQGIRAKAK